MFFKKTISIVSVLLLLIVSIPTTSSARALETVIKSDAESSSRLLSVLERVSSIERLDRQFSESEILVKLKGADVPQRVPNRAGRDILELVREYQNNVEVEYAEPNYIAYAYYVPDDSLYQYQWNFDNSQYGGVHATEAWDVTNGNGVTVAVIDTGVAYETYGSFFNRYYQAPDLAGTTFVKGYDFVNRDSHPNDDQGHGTHVTGTIAQTTNNGAGTAGLAYKASIMPLKVLNQNGSGTYADIVDAIRWAADHGADVINMSLGGSQFSSAMQDAVTYAHNKGVTIVAAAGNDGKNVLSYPAAYPEVISVGATRFDETKAPYSNYGSTIDIVAPGGDTSVDQNGDGYGDGILQQTFGSSRNSFNYYFYQGTSMATPHVAAAAAMLIAAGTATTPDAVRSVLRSSADDLGVSGRDDTYGYGLLNIAAALGASVPPPPPPPPVVDNPPTVLITAPAHNATLVDTVSINANASDDNGVTAVDFKIDGNTLGTDTTTPYNISWDTKSVANGAHTILVVAYDSIGQVATSTISVTVDNGVIVPPPPPPEPAELTIFSDSFENGLGQWTQGSQSDWFVSSRRSVDGSRSAEVDGRALDSFMMTTINLQGKTKATISYSWFIEKGFDRGEYIAFDVSTDGGVTWQNLASLNGNQDPENVWHDQLHTLTDITSLMLRFRGKVSGSSEDADVDNIVVVGSN